MKVILQPASTGNALKNYRRTVENPVALSRFRGHVSEEVLTRLAAAYPLGSAPTWGAVGGNRAQFRRMERGDLVFFYRDGQLISQGHVTFLFLDNEALANQLWDPHPKKGSFLHIFLLDQMRPVRISWSQVRRLLGYAPNYWLQRLTVLDPTKSRVFLERFPHTTPSGAPSIGRKVDGGAGRGDGSGGLVEMMGTVDETSDPPFTERRESGMPEKNTLVASFKKNRRGEFVNINLSQLSDSVDCLDIRVWYSDSEGELKPSRKGVSIRLAQAPLLLRGILDACDLAARQGLLDPTSSRVAPPESEGDIGSLGELVGRVREVLKQDRMRVLLDRLEDDTRDD
ncbi:transcriptional coactivator p15/PC4 family protein [Gemmatimonadota bacterium]